MVGGEKKVKMALGDFGPPINQRELRWAKCNLAAVPLLPGTGLVLGLQDSANKRECTYCRHRYLGLVGGESAATFPTFFFLTAYISVQLACQPAMPACLSAGYSSHVFPRTYCT